MTGVAAAAGAALNSSKPGSSREDTVQRQRRGRAWRLLVAQAGMQVGGEEGTGQESPACCSSPRLRVCKSGLPQASCAEPLGSASPPQAARSPLASPAVPCR